jgi:nucleoside-diphosphate-sugar epimerase
VNKKRIGILGAKSLVGKFLIPLLVRDGRQVKAFSREAVAQKEEGIEWQQLDESFFSANTSADTIGIIELWICVAPIWVLPDYFRLLRGLGARRVVALSSTSRFTKDDSSDHGERVTAQNLAEGELRLQAWASANDVEWVILRPTMIYGRGSDKNICEIARFICRFGFFPLFGSAKGLRQPVHAIDIAGACYAALERPEAANKAYFLAGGETLSYNDMVCRIFAALGLRPRLLHLPLWIFTVAMTLLRLLPDYRHWTKEMAARMNRDLVFDNADAKRHLNFSPRKFELIAEDLPVCSLRH